MAQLAHRVGAAFAACLLAAALMLPAGTDTAQQIKPNEQSVQEEMLLQQLQGRGAAIGGRASLPDERAGNLITPGGRDWSDLRRGTLFNITLWTFVGMLALLAIFYLVRGRIRVESGWAGRTLLRFNAVERFAHWLTAVSFIVLALTGLNLVLGRVLLLPLIGEGGFGTLSNWGKVAHNFVAWPFMLGLAMILILWIRDNIPNRLDMEWLRNAGGFFKKGLHIPAYRFNAGQKLIFWAVLIGGIALSWTGVILIFPELAATFSGWQLAQTIHGIVAAIMTAIILAHIYIGSLGMEGAFDAMGKGDVDFNWAKEHHSLWVEDALGRAEAKGEPASASRPVAPAE
ncbi:formate dehydrogenase subunit gamma [soil metagenome]